MGKYAATIHCVKKVQDHLDVMLENKELPSFRLKTENTKKLATQLREAFRYLREMDHKHYNDRYLDYLPLAKDFILKERNEFLVVERRTVVAELILDGPVIQSRIIQQHVANVPNDIFSVVGFLVEHRNLQEIVFPNFPNDIAEVSLGKLSSWCDKNNYNTKWNDKNQLVVFKL